MFPFPPSPLQSFVSSLTQPPSLLILHKTVRPRNTAQPPLDQLPPTNLMKSNPIPPPHRTNIGIQIISHRPGMVPSRLGSPIRIRHAYIRAQETC
jgi:hypothetical protein